jgi:hypothetical protein
MLNHVMGGKYYTLIFTPLGLFQNTTGGTVGKPRKTSV